eukprot:2028993-Pyramimonas_sp.AAC.1
MPRSSYSSGAMLPPFPESLNARCIETIQLYIVCIISQFNVHLIDMRRSPHGVVAIIGPPTAVSVWVAIVARPP